MIINHNISAMNTHRQLGVNTGSLAKNVEKLSSGYRINRAADDAAGLSISERMRAQIRGMEQASRNSQDGISLIQVAEGALQTVNNMLVRVKELATQSANGTYDSTNDRARMQEELDELANEVSNIKDNTKF
ncbi:flagellin, partial [Brevibacillus formosus]|nr:flagellin [Brevibacillus formosus]